MGPVSLRPPGRNEPPAARACPAVSSPRHLSQAGSDATWLPRVLLVKWKSRKKHSTLFGMEQEKINLVFLFFLLAANCFGTKKKEAFLRLSIKSRRLEEDGQLARAEAK